MNTDTLRKIFNAPYQSSIWKGFLKELFRQNVDASYFQTPIDLKDDSLVKHKDVEHIWEFGDITLSDGKTIKFYEVVLKENQQVTKNRVGLRNILSTEIIAGYIDGAIITYHNHKASDWRFTFISKALYWDEDNNEVKTETHPKRYTYLLGQNETVKTAVNQFEWLFKQIQSREIAMEDILKAFSVEKLSKEFYDGYFHQYETFVAYIVDNQKAFSLFTKQVHGDHDKAEKLVSDFVKKFLGRIVFLYFLQKKGWMGVPIGEDWGNGQRDFIFRLFEEFPDKNNFYQKALVPLFFHTLNEDRTANNDVFSVTNTRIPYLNGGLFEKDDTEPEDIQFEPQRFIELFAFFSKYNFTVDESSPDDQDIGVDPEMLGHIFENLLEDNKDKGAFYTPKEIVHYMTQESLIEYLHTHIPETNKDELTNFVKQKKKGKLSENELDEINLLLNKLKICDPAIGSGAFPMGLLHEIFALKGLIAFEQGYKEWSPARVKERIIENSIYGVDIEEGAVDIARLRFWLSLVVDEPTPRPLPNLDYKIICGNSLISRYALDTPINEVFKEFNKTREENNKVDLEKYKALVRDYMHEADHDKKIEFKQLIEDVKAAFKTFFSKKELNKLNKIKGELSLLTGHNLFGNNKNAAEKRKITKLKKEVAKLELEKKEREEAKLYTNAVEWRFEFPNLLDSDGNFEGFDIVIGNPPYIKEYTNKSAFDGFRDSPYYQGKMDIWYGFACVCLDLLKNNGIECFIAQNNWVTSAGASNFRSKVLTEAKIKLFTDFWDYKVFKSAGIQTMVYILCKNKPNELYHMKYSVLNSKKLDTPKLNEFLDYKLKINFGSKYLISFDSDKFKEGYITFNNPLIENILTKISEISDTYLNDKEIAQGIVPNPDIINSRNIKKITPEKIIRYNINVGDGVFVIPKGQFDEYSNCNSFIKKLVEPNETGRYLGFSNYTRELIYINKSSNISECPEIIEHLSKYRDVMDDRRENKNGRLEYYHLHWSRDEKFFKEGEKILGIRKADKPSFTYTEESIYVMMAFNVIVTKRFDNKYLTALLNSKLIAFWLRFKGKMQGNNYQVDKEPLLEIPLISSKKTKGFSTLVEYILYINNKGSQLNEYVPNSHISETFEEVIDAMVFELYFPEEFKQAGISFINYAERDFESIEGKLEEEQRTIIHNAYQKLREKDNEIRNNLKLMDDRLHDLIMPIKNA